jgi:hypothetical protein
LEEERDDEHESELAESDDQDGAVAVAEAGNAEEREVDEDGPPGARSGPLDSEEASEGEDADGEGERDDREFSRRLAEEVLLRVPPAVRLSLDQAEDDAEEADRREQRPG